MLNLIILLAVAAFFVSRLRKILGNEIDDTFDTPKKRGNQERVIHLRDRQDARDKAAVKPEDDAPILADIGNPEVTKGLTDIKGIEPGFNVREFLNGARMAFEMIFDAYNKEDKALLQSLLAKDVYQDFVTGIDAQSKNGSREENTLVAIQTADIVKARLNGRQAEISVQFTSEQISVTRDQDGKIIAGDASTPHLVSDEWTFSRDMKSSDPNWTLIST